MLHLNLFMRFQKSWKRVIRTQSIVLKNLLEASGRIDNTALIIEYIDLKLEALKDDIAEQYYMNQIDSSGL